MDVESEREGGGENEEFYDGEDLGHSYHKAVVLCI